MKSTDRHEKAIRAQMAAYAERIKQSTIASIRQANLSGNYALTGG